MHEISQNYLLSHCSLFDGVSSELKHDHYVLIEQGRITHVGPDRPDTSATEVEINNDCFVIPGLIDAHYHAYAVHANFSYLESLPISYIAHKARHLLERSLLRGFTTVRDAGGADHGLWMALEEGLIKGPRLFYSGRAKSQTGGHGDPRMQYEDPCACASIGNLAQIVDGVESMRTAVRESLRKGAHQIKLFVSGGISSPTDPIRMLQFSDEEIQVAVDEASRRGSYVMAHAYTGETIERAIKCGVRSIEHANLISKSAAEAVAKAGAFVVPTLSAYDAMAKNGKQAGVPKVTLDKLKEVMSEGLTAIEACIDAGVELGFGTDLLGSLHSHQLDELFLRAEVESPTDVLRSATSTNAKLIGLPNEIGRIIEGAYADLLVVVANPLEDLARLHNNGAGPPVVMKGGVVVKDNLNLFEHPFN